MVLTSTRSSADTLNDFKSAAEMPDNITVQTTDSALFGVSEYQSGTVDEMLIDECYMVHAGVLILLAAKFRPKVLKFFGDRRQVPFINRCKTFAASRTMLNATDSKYVERLTTYRCPADVCWWMSTVKRGGGNGRLYEGDVKTKAKDAPLKSCRLTPYSSSNVDIFRDADRVMTFTQMEKADLISKFLNSGMGNRERAESLIGTVAESQGETYKRVILVRFKAADDHVYSSLPHRLVALTRHTISLDYHCLNSKMAKGVGADIAAMVELEDIVASKFVMTHHV
jgi:hypothetical protein